VIGIRTATKKIWRMTQQQGGERWSSQASAPTRRARVPRARETVGLAMKDEHKADSSLMARKEEQSPIRIEVASP